MRLFRQFPKGVLGSWPSPNYLMWRLALAAEPHFCHHLVMAHCSCSPAIQRNLARLPSQQRM
jgi:hypothetical protein